MKLKDEFEWYPLFIIIFLFGLVVLWRGVEAIAFLRLTLNGSRAYVSNSHIESIELHISKQYPINHNVEITKLIANTTKWCCLPYISVFFLLFRLVYVGWFNLWETGNISADNEIYIYMYFKPFHTFKHWHWKTLINMRSQFVLCQNHKIIIWWSWSK